MTPADLRVIAERHEDVEECRIRSVEMFGAEKPADAFDDHRDRGVLLDLLRRVAQRGLVAYSHTEKMSAALCLACGGFATGAPGDSPNVEHRVDCPEPALGALQ